MTALATLLIAASLSDFVRAPVRIATSPFRCVTCERDSDGRIKRSSAVRRAFERANKKPGPGYVVDHIVPLVCGDVEFRPLDDVRNMQWQSPAESKKKDRWEPALCDPVSRMKVARQHKQTIPRYLQ